MSIFGNRSMLHFTDGVDSIVRIITEGFRPKYTPELNLGDEQPTYFNGSYGAFIPMCSFCNISLSEVPGPIMNAYGQFAIGMAEEWANRGSINPVAYIGTYAPIAISSSESARRLASLAYSVKHYLAFYGSNVGIRENVGRNFFEYAKQVEEIGEAVNSLQGFTKPYKSTDFRGQKNYVYYNEREWRYIPPTLWNENEELEFLLPAHTSQEKVNELNDKLFARKEFYLNAPIDQIKYIIISQNDIPRFAKLLRQAMKDGKFKHPVNEDDILKLVATVVTAEQLTSNK